MERNDLFSSFGTEYDKSAKGNCLACIGLTPFFFLNFFLFLYAFLYEWTPHRRTKHSLLEMALYVEETLILDSHEFFNFFLFISWKLLLSVPCLCVGYWKSHHSAQLRGLVSLSAPWLSFPKNISGGRQQHSALSFICLVYHILD